MPAPSRTHTGARILYGALALLSVVLALAYLSPATYDILTREDGLVEWLTALGLLACGTVLATRWWRHAAGERTAWRWVVGLAAVACVFGFGEEVSWGQRAFGVELTRGSFLAEHNLQGETNLHNLELGGVRVNKAVFTYGLGVALLAYFWVLPLVAGRCPSVTQQLAQVGIPVPSVRHGALATAGAVIAWLIPQSDRWESLELVLPALALATILERGPFATQQTPQQRPGEPESPQASPGGSLLRFPSRLL